MDHVKGASTRFVVASGGVLSEGNGHGGPGVCLGDSQTESSSKDMGMVCLGDGQTEAEGVPSQGGRGNALLRRMSLHLT